MENFNEVNLSRRNFVKGVLAASGAVALAAAAPAVKPFEAFAATGKLAAGTYTVTANLYVKAAINIILKKDAYLTNLGKPPLNFPTSPVSNNATLVVDSAGKMTLTISELNDTFGLIEIQDNSDEGNAHITKRVPLDWNHGGHSQRINGLTIKLDDTTGTYTFTNVLEYANYLVYEDKKWPITLTVDFSGIASA